MISSIYAKLVEIAADHHGYVTTKQAAQAGVDPVELRKLTQRGRLERAAHGVYRVTALPRTEWDELALAVAWSAGKGVISHESALVLHGLSDVNPSLIHMIVPADNFPRARGLELYRLHRLRNLPSTDVTEVQSIPVTSPFRTIGDCMANGSDPYQLRNAISQARQFGLLTQVESDSLTQRNEVQS